MTYMHRPAKQSLAEPPVASDPTVMDARESEEPDAPPAAEEPPSQDTADAAAESHPADVASRQASEADSELSEPPRFMLPLRRNLAIHYMEVRPLPSITMAPGANDDIHWISCQWSLA